MKVISNDGQEFDIDYDIAKQSTMLQQFVDDPLDDDDDDDDDPNKDIYESNRSDDISEWDNTFIKQFNVQEGTLFDIIMAANYLGIKTLLSVGCKTIANITRGKTSAEIREMFNINYSSKESENDPERSDNASEITNTIDSNDLAATSETDSINK